MGGYGITFASSQRARAVVSKMETVCDILFCSNLTGRSATVEILQSFLISFLFAITDKSSSWVYRMINLLCEMILESEIGNSSQAQGVMVIEFLLILWFQLGKSSMPVLSFPPSSDLPISQHPADPCSLEAAFAEWVTAYTGPFSPCQGLHCYYCCDLAFQARHCFY